MPYLYIPGLGIAVVAAFGLAKVGIVGVTIFVKVTEGFFNKTKNLRTLETARGVLL